MSDETIPQMRERIEALEKQLKATEKSAEEAQAANRVFQAREVARDQGYSPKTGELFAKVQTDGDITAEALAAFASENGLQPVKETTSETEETSESTDDSGAPAAGSNLGSMSGGSSASGSGGQQSTGKQTMTRQEYNELQQTDPVAAREALFGGRVELRADNPYVTQS